MEKGEGQSRTKEITDAVTRPAPCCHTVGYDTVIVRVRG